MGMCSGAPPPPDFMGASQQMGQQSQTNVNQQTQANRPNQSTPWANENWAKGPNGQWTQTTELNGPMGQAANGLQGQMANAFSTPMGTGDDARTQAINGMYGQATSRLDPRFAQEGEQLETRLANQGLSPGSAAYEHAMADYGREKNDAYTSAMNGAIGQGNQAQALTFGQNMAARNMPLQELQGLQGFLSMPGFNGASQAQTPDLLGAAGMAGNYGLRANEMNNKMWSDIIGGAGQLGTSGAMLAASDERIKTNIKRLPVEAHPGIPFATYKYKHAPEKGHQLGVIAQDVEKVRPDAVHKNEAGIRHVDYSKLKPFGTK